MSHKFPQFWIAIWKATTFIDLRISTRLAKDVKLFRSGPFPHRKVLRHVNKVQVSLSKMPKCLWVDCNFSFCAFSKWNIRFEDSEIAVILEGHASCMQLTTFILHFTLEFGIISYQNAYVFYLFSGFIFDLSALMEKKNYKCQIFLILEGQLNINHVSLHYSGPYYAQIAGSFSSTSYE